MVRASDACRRLMSIPGVGQLTALAFTAAVDDPRRFRRSRDIGAYLGLVPRCYQSGEIDYTGSISKCGDRRIRTLLYEAANVMLTRYKGPPPLDPLENGIGAKQSMLVAGTNGEIAVTRRDRDQTAGFGPVADLAVRRVWLAERDQSSAPFACNNSPRSFRDLS